VLFARLNDVAQSYFHTQHYSVAEPRCATHFLIILRANARTSLGIIKGSQSLDFDPASAALPPNGRKIRKDFLPCMAAARKSLKISGGHAAFPLTKRMNLSSCVCRGIILPKLSFVRQSTKCDVYIHITVERARFSCYPILVEIFGKNSE
jgi:hypothetical protein